MKLVNITDQIHTQNKMVYLIGDCDMNLRNSSIYEHTSDCSDSQVLILIPLPTRIIKI